MYCGKSIRDFGIRESGGGEIEVVNKFDANYLGFQPTMGGLYPKGTKAEADKIINLIQQTGFGDLEEYSTIHDYFEGLGKLSVVGDILAL